MKTKFTFLLTAGIFSMSTIAGYSQFNIGKKIENATRNRANNKVDQSINKGLNAIEEALTKKKTNKSDSTKTANAEKTTGNSNSASNTLSLQSYSKYDFVPGDKVLLFEDFSQDAVGDFPALWTTDVAGEINTLNIAPGNWLNLKSTEGTYWFMKDIDFPKNFILEMDIVPKKEAPRIAADIVLFGESSHSEMDKAGDPGTCGLHVTIEKNIWETKGYKKGTNEKLTGSSTTNLVVPEKVNHVILWV
ncbi:MAG TPA: hypothetical protein VI413_14345, partial [Paludibacter sp.]